MGVSVMEGGTSQGRQRSQKRPSPVSVQVTTSVTHTPAWVTGESLFLAAPRQKRREGKRP